LTFFWFITFGLIGLCIYLSIRQKNIFANSSTRFLQLIPFTTIIGIIACGYFFQAHNAINRYYSWADTLIYFLLLLQVLISGIVIYQTKTQRSFVIALSVLQLWLALCCSFIALMSVTNTWL
jgi:hypothetical protein